MIGKTGSNPHRDLAQARIGLQRLKSKLRSPLVSSMSIFTVAMAVRLVLQVVVFDIVAGSMGPTQFGTFASVAALTAIFSSFSGWGAISCSCGGSAARAKSCQTRWRPAWPLSCCRHRLSFCWR